MNQLRLAVPRMKGPRRGGPEGWLWQRAVTFGTAELDGNRRPKFPNRRSAARRRRLVSSGGHRGYPGASAAKQVALRQPVAALVLRNFLLG